MTANDRQRLKIFAVLLAVLATMLWIGGQMRQSPTALPIETANAGETSAFQPDVLSRVQLSSSKWEGLPDSDREPGRRNLFEYGSEPAPPPLDPPTTEPVPDPTAILAAPDVTSAPPPPPPPPPIPFKYSGYAIVDLDSGQIRAFLFDNDMSFGVTEDEVLMGRYRVNQITLTFVEVEDLEFGRRQRLPLIVE